jgi:RNA polymerase sigma factor (TIGR02999 family)
MSDETAHIPDTPPARGGIPSGALTRIIEDLRHGDMEARERLVALVYEDLRELAAAHLRRERVGHTLQPTALVHEAFLRLFGDAGAAWENRAHFFGAAGEAMRRILVDFARRRQALKRGGGMEPPPGLDDAAGAEMVTDEHAATVLAVDEALNGLAAHDGRKRKLVELRFFAGLTMEEAAETLGISLATAKRDWAFAKAWLHRALGENNLSRGL